jgi:hypothetical protein
VHVRIGDQVNIALPITGLDISQPVPFFRKRPKRLAQKCELVHFDGELVGLGPEQCPRHADPVAEVQLLDDRVGLRRKKILLQIRLQPVGAVLHHGKCGLPEPAKRDDTAGDRAVNLLLFQGFFGFLPVQRDEFARPMLHLEACAVRRDAGLPELVEFLDSLLPLFVRFIHDHTPSASIPPPAHTSSEP